MNNAAFCSTVQPLKGSSSWFRGDQTLTLALTRLGLCTAVVHRSFLHLHDELNVEKVIILLTYPWLWMNGCVPAGMLKVLGVSLCCATCEMVTPGKAFYSTQSKNTEWAELISLGSFLALRTPELYCSSNLRCENKKGATVTVTELHFLEKFMEGKSQHHASLWVCKIWSDCPKGVVVAQQKIKTLR